MKLEYDGIMKNIANTVLRALAVIVSIAAGLFILRNKWNISSTQAYGYGLLSIIIGVIIAGLPNRSWPAVGSFIMLGLYAMARATGRIQIQLLRYALGIPLVAIGIWGIYSIIVDSRAHSNYNS